MLARLSVFYTRIKAVCFHSLTVAVNYLLLAASVVLEYVDVAAQMFGDPTFNDQVKTIIGTDPKTLARYMAAVAIINLIARARSLVKKAQS